MPLYIRDETVNDLAEKLAGLIGKNKTDAVRIALEAALSAQQEQKSLTQRVKVIQARAAELGLRADGFDDRPIMDALSGGSDVH